MRNPLSLLLSGWACVYTLSLALALWRRRNRRGAVGAFILAVMVLVLPPLVQYYLTVR